MFKLLKWKTGNVETSKKITVLQGYLQIRGKEKRQSHPEILEQPFWKILENCLENIQGGVFWFNFS